MQINNQEKLNYDNFDYLPQINPHLSRVFYKVYFHQVELNPEDVLYLKYQKIAQIKNLDKKVLYG